MHEPGLDHSFGLPKTRGIWRAGTELIVIRMQPPRHLRATNARLAHVRLLATARQLSPPLGLRPQTARPRALAPRADGIAMDEGGSGQGCFAGKLYTTGSIEATTPRVRWEGGRAGVREKALGLSCSSYFSLMSAARQQEESQRQRRRGRWVCGEQERFLRGSLRPRNSSGLLSPSILNGKAQQ